MQYNKKVHVKTLEDITDEELDKLIQGLKKIEGFQFSIGSFTTVIKEDSNHETP